MPHRLEEAILRTVLYADVFSFALTPAEIHHFLIHDEPADPAEIEDLLNTSPRLRAVLHYESGYVAAQNRAELVAHRQRREHAAQALWPLARQYGIWLARMPFVRMVALTGALAVHNPADDHDDLDYLLVVLPRRVWLARAFSIVLVRLARRRGIEICPNYVLAANRLVQEQRDVFVAHEVAQMVPLYGHDLYRRLRSENIWVRVHLPNADGVFHAEAEHSTGKLWQALKTLIEWLLSGALGNWLEDWERRRKLRRFAPDLQALHSAAQLDEHQVKGHFNDHGRRVLRAYYDRLRHYNLAPQPDAIPGD